VYKKLTKLSRLFFVEILFLLSIQTFADMSKQLFMTDLIERALDEQEAFQKLLQVPQNRIKPAEIDQKQISNIINRMEQISGPGRESCWYYFYMGLLEPEINRDANYKLSLLKAENNPGNLWLLYIAFSSNDIAGWDEKALNLLEKHMLILGAEQSKIISRQMIQYAVLETANGNPEKAKYIYSNAQRFGSDDLFYAYSSSWRFFPQVLFEIPHFFQNYVHSFFTSSDTHLKTLAFIYGIIRTFLFLTLTSLVLLFLIKYLPYSLHKVIDFFPLGIPYIIKVVLVSITYMSLMSFGVLSFFWLSSVIIYKHLSKNEKTLYTIVFIIMCLIPVDVHIQSLFQRITNPEGLLSTYSHSAREGFSNKAYSSIVASISKDPDNHLLHLAAVNYSLKSNNFAAAINHIERALSLHPDDPVVLTTAGNVAFLKNDIDRAMDIYKKVLQTNPDYPEALYNMGQCLLKKMQTVDAMEMINKAVKNSSGRLNQFIKINDKYFTDSVPFLRQIIFADYTPHLFWSSLALKSMYNQVFASSYWGMAFLGIPPWWSFSVSFIILVSIIIMQVQSSVKRPLREFFECRYCGKILCRSCKNGSLCSSCSDAVKFVHNEYALEKLHTRIAAQSHLVRNISYYLADIVFPGAGYILRGELFNIKTGGLLLLTSFFYTLYYVAFFSGYSLSHFHYLHFLIIIPSVVYSLFFLFKYVHLVFKEIGSYLRSLEV
jgi:tetratricopeptide (TPR) repeat protein